MSMPEKSLGQICCEGGNLKQKELRAEWIIESWENLEPEIKECIEAAAQAVASHVREQIKEEERERKQQLFY